MFMFDSPNVQNLAAIPSVHTLQSATLRLSIASWFWNLRTSTGKTWKAQTHAHESQKTSEAPSS
jgi:hypothetical protein